MNVYLIYKWLSGPLLWLSIFILTFGTCYKIAALIYSTYNKERFIFSTVSLTYGLRSIGRWLMPFGTMVMRNNPVTTVITFAFHIGILTLPFFILSHIVIVNESLFSGLSIKLIYFSPKMVKVMTVIATSAFLLLLIRRIIQPHLRFISTAGDYGIALLIILPLITGLWAGQQLPGYRWMLLIHMLSGEVLIALIPFTRLNHMIFGFFTRIYTGSEFGKVKHAKDW